MDSGFQILDSNICHSGFQSLGMSGLPDSLSFISDSKAKFSRIPFGYLVKLSLEKRTNFQLRLVCVVYTSIWVFRNSVSKPRQIVASNFFCLCF